MRATQPRDPPPPSELTGQGCPRWSSELGAPLCSGPRETPQPRVRRAGTPGTATHTCWKQRMLSRMLNCCQRLEKFTFPSTWSGFPRWTKVRSCRMRPLGAGTPLSTLGAAQRQRACGLAPTSVSGCLCCFWRELLTPRLWGSGKAGSGLPAT